ncbi:hypothetical protein ACFOY2_52465 [Nonomuraea purpurea]|uniref:Uncharacterized protein n=1 Tax=Nonomuraea purpurea TaxID=1849276 RepID=A0ABV8GT43_9ACTN
MTTDLARLRADSALATTYYSKMFSALTAITYREKGEAAVNDLWFRVLTGHQGERYMEGLEKLGIHKAPPAVAAAKYHYFTNIIGGLKMEYVEESPRKAWVRYLAPMWMYSGVALIAMPASVRRTVFSSWHPRNGRYMGCPRLGYVGTKFSMEGDPYDEGYFIEHDRDLAEEETLRFEVVTRTPEFDPAAAPVLDPQLWPEARVLKARPKFSSGYVRSTVDCLYERYGELTTHQLVRSAMRMLATQLTPDLAAGIGGESVADIAAFHHTLVRATRREAALERVDATTFRVVVRGTQPFGADGPAELRSAFFEFHSMATRMLNGHVAASFASRDGVDVWEFTDTGRWLW